MSTSSRYTDPRRGDGGMHFKGFFRLPPSDLGRWAFGCWIASITFLVAFFGFVSAGHRGGDTFFSGSLWLPGMIVPSFAIGIAGGVVAAWALAKFKDRSALVVVSLLWGALMLFWTIAEIAFPH